MPLRDFGRDHDRHLAGVLAVGDADGVGLTRLGLALLG
jgi:hypothetical protein